MKKMISLGLCMLLVFALVGCGSTNAVESVTVGPEETTVESIREDESKQSDTETEAVTDDESGESASESVAVGKNETEKETQKVAGNTKTNSNMPGNKGASGSGGTGGKSTGSGSSNNTPDTKAPETQKQPETKAPESKVPETKAPETKAPETKAPETKKPETNTPQTNAPETKPPQTSAPETSAPQTSAPESKPPHVHNWVAQTKVVHHDAVTEQVWVQDSAAWDEPIYETRTICNGCGADITGNTEHVAWCDPGSYHAERVQTGTVHHEATGHYETRVVQEAYDETVTTGHKCACGATK